MIGWDKSLARLSPASEIAGLMRASVLQDRMVARLVRDVGGSARRWRLAIGPVKVYDTATHPDVNWSIEPTGTAHENAAIEKLLDELRLSCSIVAAD